MRIFGRWLRVRWRPRRHPDMLRASRACLRMQCACVSSRFWALFMVEESGGTAHTAAAQLVGVAIQLVHFSSRRVLCASDDCPVSTLHHQQPFWAKRGGYEHPFRFYAPFFHFYAQWQRARLRGDYQRGRGQCGAQTCSGHQGRACACVSSCPWALCMVKAAQSEGSAAAPRICPQGNEPANHRKIS